MHGAGTGSIGGGTSSPRAAEARSRDPAEDRPPVRIGAGPGGDRGDGALEGVDPGIRVHPGVGEAWRVHLAHRVPDLGERQEPQSRGDQEAQGELHRGGGVDEPEGGELGEERAVARQGGPGVEGDEGRREGEARRPRARHQAPDVEGGVALVEAGEDGVVEALHRGGHEQAPGVCQGLHRLRAFQEVGDLHGDVVGELGEAGVECADQRQGVARAVEEVRVAEGQVLRAGGNLLRHVREDHLLGDDAEAPVVDRDHRAVAAGVLAAAAGLGVAGDPLRAAHPDLGVARERGETGAVGDLEVEAVQGRGLPGRQVAGEGDQLGLALAPQDRKDPEAPEVAGVEGGVEAEAAEGGAGAQGPDAGDHLGGDPGGSVHGHVEGHQLGGADRLGVELLPGQILDPHRVAGGLQPRRRLGHRERRVAELVGGQEEDVPGHGGHGRSGGGPGATATPGPRAC